MKKQYERPVIHPLNIGRVNQKHARNAHYINVREDIDGVAIDSLIEEYGSPLFVLSEKTIRERYRMLSELFATRYPNVQFSWSVKTNYLDAVCMTLYDEGEFMEVVSEFEYQKVRRLGVPGHKIIFNGPYKPSDALATAIEEGAMINIDHIDEIYALEKVAKEMNRKDVPIGIRLNMDTGIQPQWTRFGLNYESGQAWQAVKRIISGGILRINGLHCHLGTFVLSPEAYGIQVQKMIELAVRIQDTTGQEIEYLDIGGGFPSNSSLKAIYLPPDVAIPSYDAYAEAICTALLTYLPPNYFPKLFLETGRAIVDEAGYLISSVVASKRMPTGVKTFILDAGVNFLYTSTWYKFQIETTREISGMGEFSVLYGPLCMNIDVVDEGRYLPPLSKGDQVIIRPVGAYNMTQWMQFIRYRPAIVMITQEGEPFVVRKGEDLDDVVRNESIPDRLKLH